MRLLTPLLLLLLAACAANPRTVGDRGDVYEVAATPSAAEVAATANIYREAVGRSQRVGRALYEKDVAAAFATQLLLDADILQSDREVVGWITQQSEGTLLVTYVAERAGRRVVGYEVAFPDGPFGAPTLAPTPNGTPLAGERATMYAARETAIGELARQPQCNSVHNPVVLPASLIGEEGWLVYLLVATVNPGERVLSGHALARISADGRSALGLTPLSLTCRIEPIQVPEGTEESGIYLVHSTSAWPLETHVYTSLITRLPVYVQTSAGTWTVNGDSIELTNLTASR